MTDLAPESRRPCPDAANSVTCQDCVEFLIDYLDGRLSESEKFRFESHIALCRDCEVYLANYRKAIELTSQAGGWMRTRSAPPAPEALIQAILRARSHEH